MTKITVKQCENEITQIENTKYHTENIKYQMKRIKTIAIALENLGIPAGDELTDSIYYVNRDIERINVYIKAQKRKYSNQLKRLQK